MWNTSVFSGCASWNTRANVAPKWRNTSTFCREATEFLKEYCKGRRIGDGLEETDRCISPLDYPTWTQTISSCGVVWSRDCIIVGSRMKVSVSRRHKWRPLGFQQWNESQDVAILNGPKTGRLHAVLGVPFEHAFFSNFKTSILLWTLKWCKLRRVEKEILFSATLSWCINW
jgi:hypothetical protein